MNFSALPQVVNLSLYQGDDFMLRIAVNDPDGSPTDLFGATVMAHIRISPGAPLIGEFDITMQDNVIFLHLSNKVSVNLAGRLVYDAEVTLDSGWVRTLVAGTIDMTPDVSR